MTEPVQYAAWYGTNASTVASALAYRYHAVPCPQPSVRWTARLYRNPMSSTFRILPTRCTTGSGMKPTSRPSPFTAAGPRLREHS